MGILALFKEIFQKHIDLEIASAGWADILKRLLEQLSYFCHY